MLQFSPFAPRLPSVSFFWCFRISCLTFVGFFVGLQGQAWAQQNERALFVSVTDASGSPVLNLPPSEFLVEEDGAQREVLRVEATRKRMQVALLVDTSAAAAFALADIRTGLETLVATLHQDNEIALVTFGGPPRILVESTSRLNRLQDGIGRVFAFSDSASYLLDALVQTARGFERRESPRPVVIVLTSEGTDYSRSSARDALEALEATSAATHVVILLSRSNVAGGFAGFDGNVGANDPYQRNLALAQLPEATGGQRRDLLLSSALGRTLRQLTTTLMNQYELVYSRPTSLIPPEEISVRMRRDDLRARATPVKLTITGNPQ